MAPVLASTVALMSASDGPPLHVARTTVTSGMPGRLEFHGSSGEHDPVYGREGKGLVGLGEAGSIQG